MEYVYSYSPRATGVHSGVNLNLKIRLIKRNVLQDLLKYTEFGCLKWRLPNEIANGNDEVKAAFLRGYFYGDGCCSNNEVFFASANETGIKQVSDVLNSLGINHKINSYMPKPPRIRKWTIGIRKREMVRKFGSLVITNNNAGIAKARLVSAS